MYAIFARKKLGSAACIALLGMVFFVPLVLFGNLYHFHSLGFFIIFFVTTLLNTVILYWPAKASGATEHKTFSVTVKVLGIGMVLLNVVLAGMTLPVTTPIAAYLQGISGFLFSAGVYLLVLVFLITHYFLFRFFRAWLQTTFTLLLVGLGGVLMAGYLFFFHWANRWTVWERTLDIIKENLLFAGEAPLMVLHIIFYFMMLYFFIALFPCYLTSLPLRKKFSVSRRMHATYLYIGVSGLVGYFTVILYPYAFPGSI